MDGKGWGALEDRSTDYLWPRCPLVGKSWDSLNILLDRQRQSVTRMIERYDQRSPSVVCRPRLWATGADVSLKRTESKAVQGCFLSQELSAIMQLSAGWPRQSS